MKVLFLAFILVQPTQDLDSFQVKVEKAWARLYSGQFPYASEWNASLIRMLGVERTPVKLVWVNPTMAIPSLGIEAGKPLAPHQKTALEYLLGVQITTSTTPQGQAGAPTNVGRAINPSLEGLDIIIGDGRHQRGELTGKGTGPNKGERDGLLDTSEALMDAEISHRLRQAGVETYQPVAVFQRTDRPEKAIYWRMPVVSLVRADDLRNELSLSDSEVASTVRRIASNVSAYEGRPISVSELLGSVYPRQMGESAGRLRGLGVVHGTISWPWGGGNAGVGELVDWGAAGNGVDSTEFTSDPNYSKFEANRKDFRSNVERTLGAILPRIPEASTVKVDEALQAFGEAYEAGRKAIEKSGARLQVRRDIIEKLSGQDLGNLVRGLGAEHAVRKKQLEALEKAGFLTDGAYDRVGVAARVRQEAAATGAFVAAYLLKEAAKSLATGDTAQIKSAAAQLGTLHFWRDVGLFTLAARGAQIGLARAGAGFLAMETLPLAAGMTAVELASGHFSAVGTALDVGSFVAAGYLVRELLPALVASTPSGRASAWTYSVAKLALTLYVGEGLSTFLRGWLARYPGEFDRSGVRREGAARKVGALGER